MTKLIINHNKNMLRFKGYSFKIYVAQSCSPMHSTDTKENTDYVLLLQIETDASLLYLHELFYQMHKFIENHRSVQSDQNKMWQT